MGTGRMGKGFLPLWLRLTGWDLQGACAISQGDQSFPTTLGTLFESKDMTKILTSFEGPILFSLDGLFPKATKGAT